MIKHLQKKCTEHVKQLNIVHKQICDLNNENYDRRTCKKYDNNNLIIGYCNTLNELNIKIEQTGGGKEKTNKFFYDRLTYRIIEKLNLN